ncbi:unnamed protein product, partial [Phaeothamnion confervicola]
MLGLVSGGGASSGGRARTRHPVTPARSASQPATTRNFADESFRPERASFLGDLQALNRQLRSREATLLKANQEKEALQLRLRREMLKWRATRAELMSEMSVLRTARQEGDDLLAASIQRGDQQAAELEGLKVSARRADKLFREQLETERRQHKSVLEEAAAERKALSQRLEALQLSLQRGHRAWGSERGTYAAAAAEATQRAELAMSAADELRRRGTEMEERLSVAM